MLKRIMAVVFALGMSATASANTCRYDFTAEGGEAYSLDHIVAFVTEEIRPRLGNDNAILDIHITERCPGKKPVVNTLGMNTKNLYLLTINKLPLPDHIVRYNNRLPLTLNKANFEHSLSLIADQDFLKFYAEGVTRSYQDVEEEIQQQKILKMLAFVFAEAPRFESAEVALKKTMTGNCSISWHDFDFALHNWSNMSRFVIDTETVGKKQYRGGGADQLLAPVTLKQEAAFLKAVEAGEDYRFSHNAVFGQYDYEC